MYDDRPIGIFDSGVGGTSIWREIVELLPHENTVYLADIKNAPYGEKPRETILSLSIKNTELLLEKKCKLIVVACNTATTNAIDYLRSKYDIPFIGIEPAIKPALLSSKNGAVGILATKGTLSSALFAKTSSLYAQGIDVVEVEGQGIVKLIENGKLNSMEMRKLLRGYLAPMIARNIDYLVLGCTHYPYLTPMLKELLPENVNIIDSGQAVARQTKAIMDKLHLNATSKEKSCHRLYSNASLDVLQDLTKASPTNKEIRFLDF